MHYGDLWSLLLAVFLGGLIGVEREIRGKAAGLRTNILICLGAAIFTIVSKSLAGTGDVTRIAAQVVSGIGFLGAGAIIQDRGGIHGLTTAATIWLVSSIGVCCGAKEYAVAGVSTIIALLVLLVLGKLPFEHRQKHTKGSTPKEDYDSE